MRKIGYARVSTEDQNLSLQLDALKAAGCDKVYRDHGVSGNQDERPGLRRALKQAKAGDTIVVWRLDRLGRSLGFLIKLIEQLGTKNVEFCSLSDGIDTATSSGKLVFHIMGALAEFERDLIRERTVAGMAAAKARGVLIGRPRKLMAAQVSEAEQLYRKGATLTELAKQYGVDRSTLSRALSRHRYSG